MAVAIYADEQEFRAMHFGMPRSEDRAVLRERMEENARRYGLEGSDFFARALDRFNSFDFDRIERKISAVRRRVTHMFDRDEITWMSSIGKFQQAGPIQQRWLLANPRIKQLAERELLRTWGNEYPIPNKGRYGDDDPDYRAVMNGMYQTDADGNDLFVIYPDAYSDDGRGVLSFEEQTILKDSMWANFIAYVDEGLDDPSDPENGSL